jgi:hypothetical protein
MQQRFVLRAIEWWFRHQLNKVLIGYIECHIVPIFIGEVLYVLIVIDKH